VDLDDWTLTLAGDGDAFGRVFDRHRDRIRRHAHALVPVPADAEDVVAMTFLEAWRKRSRVRLVDDSLLPWLLVTATNLASNLRRGSRRHAAMLARLPAIDDTVSPVDPDNTDGSAVRALAGPSAGPRRARRARLGALVHPRPRTGRRR